jgi:hypothetical protein
MNEFCLETKHATATKATTLKKDRVHIYDPNCFPTLHKITSTTTTTTIITHHPPITACPIPNFPSHQKNLLHTYITHSHPSNPPQQAANKPREPKKKKDMSRPTPSNNTRRDSFQPPIVTLGAALYSAYQTRKEKRNSGSAQEIGRSGGKYSPVAFENRWSDREREAVATLEGFGLEKKREKEVVGVRGGEGDGDDVLPPDYEDVFGEDEGKGDEKDGGDPFELRDAEEEGRGFLAAAGDGDESVGGGKMESEGAKMGFFERMRARREAKRSAWMEKRGGRGGFGCRGGRRGRCM